MLTSLKKAWRTIVGEGVPPLATQEVDGVFRLSFGRVHIGTLRHEHGEWIFEYSEQFKLCADLRPLPQFPDRGTVYRSEELWPFFGMRIPSLKQPSVQETITREKIDQTDRVQLLRRFGRRTVANPYELVEAVA